MLFRSRWLVFPLALRDLRLEYYTSLLSLAKNEHELNASAYHKKAAEFDDAISHTVRMSTLDGAVLMNERFEVLGFGAKLQSKKVTSMAVPHGNGGTDLDLSVKGTRHLSAYSWVSASKKRMALVVSQDKVMCLFARRVMGDVAYWNLMPSLFE